MTSKRLYAVATLALSALLPLSACSQADSPEREAKPTASATAYPQPAYKVTHEQLRAVTVVGARLVDNSPSAPTKSEAITVGFCDRAYNGTKGRSWYSTNEVMEPAEGLPPGLAGNDSTQIGWTFNTTTVLDDSSNAVAVIDERIRSWATCQPEDEPPLTTQKVAIPGTAASVVRTQVAKDVSPWNAHAASGVARVENALVSCTVNARTAKLALATVTSCLTEMAEAVPFAAGQKVKLTEANRGVAAKMLLARAATKGQTVTVRTTGATRPCRTSKETFLPAQQPLCTHRVGPGRGRGPGYGRVPPDRRRAHVGTTGGFNRRQGPGGRRPQDLRWLQGQLHEGNRAVCVHRQDHRRH